MSYNLCHSYFFCYCSLAVHFYDYQSDDTDGFQTFAKVGTGLEEVVVREG